MYAVIRAGGKQYRVAPGDVIRVEKQAANDGLVEFSEVLAVSGEEGKVGKPGSEARVTGQVVEEGRGAKILVANHGVAVVLDATARNVGVVGDAHRLGGIDHLSEVGVGHEGQELVITSRAVRALQMTGL